MRRALSVGGVSAAAVRALYRALLGAGCFAGAMAPGIGVAQQTASPTADSGAATLPEIRVIGTTPLPPPPAARPAASATPAATVATPAEPGATDRDKVPSNIQTLSTADFDPATTPSLLDALARGLPGVARATRPEINSSSTSITAASSPRR